MDGQDGLRYLRWWADRSDVKWSELSSSVDERLLDIDYGAFVEEAVRRSHIE